MAWLLSGKVSDQTAEMYTGMVRNMIRKGAEQDLDGALAQFSPSTRRHRGIAWGLYYTYKMERTPDIPLPETFEHCTQPGCYRTDMANLGMCEGHFKRWMKGADPTSTYNKPNRAELLPDGSAHLWVTNRQGEEIKAIHVDQEDLPRLQLHRWSISLRGKRKKRPYLIAQANSVDTRKGESRKTLLLHRYIMDAPKGLQVDHINGDPFDNRRENLRIVTRAQQNQNVVGGNNNTGYRNVYRTRSGKYSVCVGKNKKRHFRGPFVTVEEAVEAARALRKELFPFVNENRLGNSVRRDGATSPLLPYQPAPRKPRKGKEITFRGATYRSLAHLVEEKGAGLSYNTVWSRVYRRGWSLEKALSLQVPKK